MLLPPPSALRLPATALALIACCSCVPGAHSRYRLTMAVPGPDQSLLHQLALADPLAKPATAPAPGAGGASPFAAAPPFLASLATDDGRRAEDCLTAAVYYEARSEPLDGQRAVAQVVLNRVRDRAFPANVCGVVYQHSAAGCQFTFACDGSTTRALDPRSWAVARAVADAALGGSVYAPVGAATHYHATYVSPWWAPSLARVAAVGSHIFYRWKSGLADALSFRQAYAGGEGGAPTPGAVMAATADGPATEHGVTVHRSGDDGAAPASLAAAPASGAPAAGAPPADPTPAFGVRVHRGIDAGVPMATDDAADH